MATNASKSQITFWSSTLIDFQTKEVTDSLTIVKLSGKLNEVTRSYFFQCIGDTLDGGCKQVVVDCNGLGMLGSAAYVGSQTRQKKRWTDLSDSRQFGHCRCPCENKLEQIVGDLSLDGIVVGHDQER